jgi:hypothetical protein
MCIADPTQISRFDVDYEKELFLLKENGRMVPIVVTADDNGMKFGCKFISPKAMKEICKIWLNRNGMYPSLQ